MSDQTEAAERRADRIRALREERHALEVRGLIDRVAQVDAELARFGVKSEGGKAAAPKRDAAGGRGRRTTKG